MIALGSMEDFQKLPVKIELCNTKCFLVRVDDEYKLLSSICPHQSGEIKLLDDEHCFKCEVHHWTFDLNGKSKNIKSMQMLEYPVIVQDGQLYVDLHIHNTSEKVQRKTNKLPIIKLHAHACIEVKLDDFTLICDPWIEGNAFLGAWIHYPEPIVKVTDLQPNAIWISHEHSDHFHEPTLKKFDKTIPVYVPHFPNCRMEQKLEELGFENIISVRFGEPVQLAEHFKITTYEPASLWNDALVLIEAGDFRILNLNDTGINRTIAKEIGTVDMVASSFSPGASGYPLTWSHLSDEEKRTKMKSAKIGILKMIEQSIEIYKAKYFLPFASYFSLWYKEHLKYIDLLEKNTVLNVCDYFENSDVKVIDLLPGDEWHIASNQLVKQQRDAKIFDKQYILNYIKSQDFSYAFNEVAPIATEVTHEMMEKYFLNLNNIPEMIFCEDVTVQVNAYGAKIKTVCFEVKSGHLSIVEKLEQPNITFNVPEHILHYVIAENESWDEPIIGYWCNFSRSPDVYHADFWRLLQAPYYKKQVDMTSDSNSYNITLESNVASLLEVYGEEAERILGRYGLYCIACLYAPYENIKNAAQIHGLSEEKQQRLVKELNRCLVE
ncbi:Rieske 2Fe-2S domain-containing protein [Lysinibacillus sp. NPDC094403]|uniref:Rieske 2Fe-2S domain-containing protein n=1 Tax=Lysinibacillus sp. NPDC094403 TaxID=3390581 RepID=UPI003D05432A